MKTESYKTGRTRKLLGSFLLLVSLFVFSASFGQLINGEELRKENALYPSTDVKMVSIYPNPAQSMVYIGVRPEAINLEHAFINITDLASRPVKKIMTVSESNLVAVNTWSRGMYIIEISDGVNRITRKIIKD